MNSRRITTLFFVILFVAGVAIVPAPVLHASGAELLRLVDAVHEAIVRSTATADAADAVALAESALRVSRSTVSPQFTLDALGAFGQSNLANQNYGARFSQQFLSGTQVRADIGATSSQNQLGTYFASNTVFSVTQPMLRGFGGAAVRRDLTLVSLRAEEARRDQTRVAQQVALSMASAYYGVVTQTRMVEVSDQAFARAKTLLEAAEAKLALGKVSKLDVLRARQFAMQAELQALDARTAVENAKDQVRLLLLRDAAFDFVVEPEVRAVRMDVTLDEALTAAANHRIELTAATASVREASMQLSAAEDRGRPQVDVTLQMTRNAVASSLGSAFGRDAFRLATFAGVSMPLDRTPADVARQTAALQVARATRHLEQARLQIAQEVRAAHRESVRLVRTLEQADIAIGFAQQEVELADLRYQRGLSNNLDLVTAEAGLLNARALRLGAQAGAAVAHWRLRAATGLLDPSKDFR